MFVLPSIHTHMFLCVTSLPSEVNVGAIHLVPRHYCLYFIMGLWH